MLHPAGLRAHEEGWSREAGVMAAAVGRATRYGDAVDSRLVADFGLLSNRRGVLFTGPCPMPNQDPSIAQELLSHQAFLRRLAIDLAGEDADDLVQEVWRRALERPPHHGRQLRGWLAQVARNLASNRWRDETRRKTREERRASEQPAAENLDARLELRKELVEALESLSPSSRETVLLRYFEGLAPRDIARRQGIPVATVKKRLQRGLVQLREALDKRYGGDRTTWMSAVTALAAPVDSGVGTGTLAIGGIAMGTMMKVSAVIVVAATCVYFATRPPQTELPRLAVVEPVAAEAELEGEPERLAVLSVAGDPATESGQRSPVAEEPPAGEPAAAGANVLRVIFEGMTPEYAEMATVTITGVSESSGRPAKIREAWPCSRLTSEFDLDPFLSRLAKSPEVLRDDALVILADHPLHFSEATQVALTSGTQVSSGETLYEVRVQLARVVYWPELTLAVRDANTRAHLEDVELRCVPTAYMGSVQQPGASDPFTVIGGGLSSPIAMRGGRKASGREEWASGLALQPEEGAALRPAELVQPEKVTRGVLVYARAPGYAWGRLVLDVSKGATRELLLGPAAALSVRLANVQLEAYAALEMRATLFVRKTQPDGSEETVWSRNLEEALDTEVLRIGSLEPGEYAVLVELSESWKRKPMELGRETISIPAGEAGEVLLVIPDPPEPRAHATLAGVVSFPDFGGEENVRLEFYGSDYRYGDPHVELPLTELEPVAAVLPTWSFRVEDLPVDRYQVRLLPFLKSWMIDVPEGGREDVELAISELAEVLVETVDARTGERVPLEAIAYRELEVHPDQVTHGGRGPWFLVEFEDELGRFRLWMAPGAMAARPQSNPDGVDYSSHSEEFVLAPGFQSVRLELNLACTLRVEFRVDGAALPHEDGIFSGLSRSIRAVGHDGRVGGMYPYSLFQATAPGVYEISFEGVGADRFLPIPSRRVEMREGETAKVVVELQRK